MPFFRALTETAIVALANRNRDLTGWWSVHIDKANRLVFKIEGEELVIYSCAGHYE